MSDTNAPSRSDIGPLSETTSLGEAGGTPAAKATEANAKQPRPDSGGAVLEGESQSIAAQPMLQEKNGAEPDKGPSASARGSAPAAAANDATLVGKPWPALDYSQKHDAVEAQLLERMRAKYGTALVRDMADAQELLSYVTRNGLQVERKVDDNVIQNLIASREHMRSFTFDSEKEEMTFRKNCGVIAKAAEPVTAASLHDSFKAEPYRRWLIMEPEPMPVAEIACRRYRALAIVVLVALLVVQIYWTALSSILGKTDALISELNKAPTKQFYLAQEAARIAALKAQTSSGSAVPPVATTNPTVSPTPAANDAKTDKAPLTLDELVSRNAQLDANYSILEKFVNWWPLSKLYFVREKPAPSKASDEKGTPPNTDAIFIPSVFQDRSASSCAVAGQVIDVIQKWVLPLLYGALGAMVFVVRTLSVQARDRLFRREALVSLVLRVFLGMISGLAIGWFWNQNPAGATAAGALTITTLSPFALAFVAGYGVELFFALLDKIVSTFTNK
jgi:hypothetical protein